LDHELQMPADLCGVRGPAWHRARQG